MSDDEVRRKNEKPTLRAEGALGAGATLFSCSVAFDESFAACEIDSYDDRNFVLRGWRRSKGGEGEEVGGGDPAATSQRQPSERFILKVHNGVESTNIDFVRAQVEALEHLSRAGFVCPQSLPASRTNTLPSDGKSGGDDCIAYLELDLLVGGGKRKHAVRLLPWIEGKLLSEVEQTSSRLEDVGRFLANVDMCLQSFDHPSCHRTHMWDLQNFSQMKNFIGYILDEKDRNRVETVLDQFETVVLPSANSFRRSIIQCDANDHNIIVDVNGERKVNALIDFGDMCYTWLVNQIAIGMAYIVVGCVGKADVDPLEKALDLLRGYNAALPLNATELKCLRILVAARLAQSVTLGAFSLSKDPENEYLKLHAVPGKKALELLVELTDDAFGVMVTKRMNSIE